MSKRDVQVWRDARRVGECVLEFAAHDAPAFVDVQSRVDKVAAAAQVVVAAR